MAKDKERVKDGHTTNSMVDFTHHGRRGPGEWTRTCALMDRSFSHMEITGSIHAFDFSGMPTSSGQKSEDENTDL